jgi:PST family polysaccharide transporter
MTLGASRIVTTVFGVSFVGTISVLQIYIWSNVWISITTVLQLYLVNENKKHMLFWTSFVGMITNIALNLVLIPAYGPTGAAIATLISYSIPVFSILCTRKTRSLLYRHRP